MSIVDVQVQLSRITHLRFIVQTLHNVYQKGNWIFDNSLKREISIEEISLVIKFSFLIKTLQKGCISWALLQF